MLRVEGEVGRNEGGDGTTKVLLLFESGTDESPSGLVVVPFGSLEWTKRVEGDGKKGGERRGGWEANEGQLSSIPNRTIDLRACSRPKIE